MAGWVIAWTRAGSQPDPASWSRSLQALAALGCAPTEQHHGRIRVAAWRRASGEFPKSGMIESRGRVRVVWVGQCVEDDGDATERAIDTVARDPFDGPAVSRLNGPFAAATMSNSPFRVELVTDRHRNYPVYVHRSGDVTVASTEMSCVIPWLAAPTIDRDAVDLLLRSGELIDRMTMLSGVDFMPPGTVLTDDGEVPRERRYFRMRHDGSSSVSMGQTADILAPLLRQAVRRIERANARLGVTLSGGLDSRLILALCNEPEKVKSFTWGLPGCRDIACATEFAQQVHSPHVIRHWDPSAFPPLWARGVDLTAGSYGVDGMHMLPFVPLLASACDVVLNGLAGDGLLGGNFLKYSWLHEPSATRLGRASWRWRVSPEEDACVDRLMGRKLGPSTASERWAASVAATEGARPVERLQDWLYENRIFRYTSSGTMLLRSGVESHAPFFDRDFLDAVVRVRQDYKFKHRLYLQVMMRAAPNAAKVTWQRTNVPASWGFVPNLTAMVLQRLATTACKRIGVNAFPRLAVADPAAWLRGPWRPFVEDLVVRGLAPDHGLWDGQAARDLLADHVRGLDRTRQISGLVATELFLRNLLGKPAEVL
jgi:asparagine synthase (glutamine-hydrolysing)